MKAITEHTHSAIIALFTIILCTVVGITLAGCSNGNTDKIGKLTVSVNAEGYNADTSTPVEIAVYKDDVKGLLEDDDPSNDPEVLTTFTGDANTAFEIAEASDKGTYTVVVKATPVLEDGTLFSIPEIQVIEVGSDDANATFDLETIDLATASAEEVAEVTEQASAAAANSGNEAKATAAATGTAAAATKAEKAGNTKAASTAKQQASKPATSSKPSASQGSSSSGSSSASKPTQAQPSAPAHEHNWVAQTKVVHHKAETKRATICNTCGADITGNITAHQKAHAKKGESGSYHIETITVKAAYDETVTTGYKCSGCGATK